MKSDKLADYVTAVGLGEGFVQQLQEMKFETKEEFLAERYKVEVRRRLPTTDIEGFDFPQQLHMFAFPMNAQILENPPTNTTPKSFSYHSFVMTELDGHKFYGFCLTSYIPMSKRKLALVNDRLRQDLSLDNDPFESLFEPVCLCIISHFAFHSKFLEFFQALVAILNSNTKFNSRAVRTAYDLLSVKVSPMFGADVMVGTKKLRFNHTTSDQELPFADVDFHVLLRSLSAPNLMSIFTALLNETQLLFISSDISKLTPLIESLLHLLYPFEWAYMYVPVLPCALTDFFQAPMPFIIGVHRDALVDAMLPENALVVDIDENLLSDPVLDEEPFHLPARYVERILRLLCDVCKPTDVSKLRPGAKDSKAEDTPHHIFSERSTGLSNRVFKHKITDQVILRRYHHAMLRSQKSVSPTALSPSFLSPETPTTEKRRRTLMPTRSPRAVSPGARVDEGSGSAGGQPTAHRSSTVFGDRAMSEMTRQQLIARELSEKLSVHDGAEDDDLNFAYSSSSDNDSDESDSNSDSETPSTPFAAASAAGVVIPYDNLVFDQAPDDSHSHSRPVVGPCFNTPGAQFLEKFRATNSGAGSTLGVSSFPLRSRSTPRMTVIGTMGAGSKDASVVGSAPTLRLEVPAHVATQPDELDVPRLYVSFSTGALLEVPPATTSASTPTASSGSPRMPLDAVRRVAQRKRARVQRVRGLFLSVFVSLFNQYRFFLNAEAQDSPFQAEAFMEDMSSTQKRFVTRFCLTQAFSVFIQDRITSSKEDIFETRCVEKMQRLGLKISVLSNARKRGYLYKEGQLVKNWRKRWAILEHSCLSYFADESSSTVKGKIVLVPGGTKITLVRAPRKGQPTKYGFAIVAQDRTLYCCVDDAGELRDWIKHLRAQVMSREERLKLENRVHIELSQARKVEFLVAREEPFLKSGQIFQQLLKQDHTSSATPSSTSLPRMESDSNSGNSSPSSPAGLGQSLKKRAGRLSTPPILGHTVHNASSSEEDSADERR